MDRNQVIGFILIFAILLGYTYFNAPTAEELASRKSEVKAAQDMATDTDTLTVEEVPTSVETQQPAGSNTNPDSAKIAANRSFYGDFAQASIGEAEELVLENEDLEVVFSSKGGRIISATVKNHVKTIEQADGSKTYEVIKLLNNPKNKFGYFLPMENNPAGGVNTDDLYFTPKLQGNELTFVLNTGTGGKIEQKYTLDETGFNLNYEVYFNGLQNSVNSGSEVELNWINYLNKLELNESFEQRYSTVYFKESDDSNADYCSCSSDDEETMMSTPLDWISHSNQFFNTSLIADGRPFRGGELITKMTNLENNNFLKKLESKMILPIGYSNDRFSMKMYVGPNEFDNLRTYNKSLEQIIPFGNSIFGTINRWVIRPFFDFLSTFIGSKGIVILVLIFIIKMMLYPLMYKMLHSQALMGALKPRLSHLNEKYKDEPQKKQVETMKIYREYGVSPLGGCLPMILQMPIWYALFRFFPASIEFRQESFLWAHDLSTYDDVISLPFELPFMGDHLSLFTILWAVTTVIYTYYNTRHTDMSANPAMKYMQYLMPVMFLGFFNTYAAGLTAYMFFSNMINILQTLVTKQFIFTDAKLEAELARKKAKPKKKSSFQERLEEAMKQQQAMQQQKGKKK